MIQKIAAIIAEAIAWGDNPYNDGDAREGFARKILDLLKEEGGTMREATQEATERRRKRCKTYYENHKDSILKRLSANQLIYLQTEQGKQMKKKSANRMFAKYPEKYKARYTLRNAVRLGIIKKQPCEKCGDNKSHGHHDDYSKPLEVRWLCHKCHCLEEGRWVRAN